MEITREAKVALLKEHYQEHSFKSARWADRGYSYPAPVFPIYPDECRGLRCEAKTRRGTPCKNDGTSYVNGRCKFHGGPSTGPKTVAGKKKSAMNGFKRHTNPMET